MRSATCSAVADEVRAAGGGLRLVRCAVGRGNRRSREIRRIVSSQYGKNRSSALPSSLMKPMPETLTSCIAPGRSVCSNARR